MADPYAELIDVGVLAVQGAVAEHEAAGQRVTFGSLLTPAGLRAMAGYADIVAPNTRQLIGWDAEQRQSGPTRLIAEAHADEDKKKQELIEARNIADTMIYTTEKMMKEVEEKSAQGGSASGGGETSNWYSPEEISSFILAKLKADAEAKLNEQVEANVALTKTVNEQKRAAAIAEAADGLTDTEVEKFKGLAEELSFEDVESFGKKLQKIGRAHV